MKDRHYGKMPAIHIDIKMDDGFIEYLIDDIEDLMYWAIATEKAGEDEAAYDEARKGANRTRARIKHFLTSRFITKTPLLRGESAGGE